MLFRSADAGGDLNGLLGGAGDAGGRFLEAEIGEEGVEAIVKVIEPTGSETHVAVEVEGKELTWVLRERVNLTPEQRVSLSFATPKVHFFDRQTQNRLDA